MSYGNNPIDKYKKQQTFEKIPVDPREHSLRRAAKFIMLLGEEEGSQVLRHLSEEEVEKICSEIANIKHIDPDEIQDLLQEFGVRKELNEDMAQGGLNKAKSYLVSAFGEDKAQSILKKVLPKDIPGPFDFLKEVELPQLLYLLKEESILVVSLVLSQIESARAAEYIKTLDPEISTSLIKRMAYMKKVDASVLEKTAENLMEKLNSQSAHRSEEVDGQSRLAEILKHLDGREEKRILSDLKEYDPEIEIQIREKLFTLDSLFLLRPVDLQKAIQDYSEKDLALFLRDKSEDIQNLIKDNLSSRRRALLEDERAYMGPVLRKDVDKITSEFIRDIRKKTEDGIYILLKEGEYL